MGQDFTHSKLLPVDWAELHRDTVELSHILRQVMDEQGVAFKGIVAVARGGLVPAAILARELDIRLVDTVCVVSYDDKVQRDGEVDVLKSCEGDGQGWLVVDDLVDSGKTFRRLRQMLPKAYYATVYAKPLGRDVVDSTVKAVEQDRWIVFPWDEQP